MSDLGQLAYGIGVNTLSKLGVPVVLSDGASLPSNYPPDACKYYEGNEFETETKILNIYPSLVIAIRPFPIIYNYPTSTMGMGR